MDHCRAKNKDLSGHMNYIELLDLTARQLDQIIRSEPEVEQIETPDYGWENHRYSSPKFRLAHVEIFNQDRFMVVHCCVFPHADDPAPIFGFDVIAGEHKVTGVFLDLSPTVQDPGKFHNLEFKKQRERPEWGDIFSQNWIACRPDQEEMSAIVNEAQRLLQHYLDNIVGRVRELPEIVRFGQNRYCEQQRKNEHTYKALKNLLGENGAREFMDDILFPTI